jgi:hypothetical protein
VAYPEQKASRATAGTLTALTLAGLFGAHSFACSTSEEGEHPDAVKSEGEQEDAGANPDTDLDKPMTLEDCQWPACPLEEKVDPEARAVSFRDDIFPTVQRACSDLACHGLPSDVGAGLFLGEPPPAKVDTSEIVARLVGVPSQTAPDVLLVEAGDPASSFFVHKIEGCQALLDSQCEAQPGATSGEPCGDPMPKGGRPICRAERILLKTWIAQGAKDN